MTESIPQPRPIISVAISSTLIEERESLLRALSGLAQQDSTLRIKAGFIDGVTTLCGMGELHLEVICNRILQEYKIQLEIGEPQVIYLETIRESAEAEGKYIRQIGDEGSMPT